MKPVDLRKELAMTSPSANAGSPPRTTASWLDHVAAGTLYYYLTTLVVMLGVFLGCDYIAAPAATAPVDPGFLTSVTNWDGRHYVDIMLHGYSFDPQTPSNVAFFPGYPLLGRLVMQITGLQPELTLFIISHVALLAAFISLAAYVSHRQGPQPLHLSAWVLLSLGLFPTSFFFRMAYSESLFLFASILALYAMERRWPISAIACIVGFAGITRPVGLALLAPLALHLWQRWPWLSQFLPRMLLYGALSCWGLLAYMGYQYAAFDEPCAFAQTQGHWRVRPPASLADKLLSLATFEPIWSVVDPASPCCWERYEPRMSPLFALSLANPIFFLIGWVLIVVGQGKQWISGYEFSFSIFVLLIPYLTRSYENCMLSMGRFTAVAFPIYLVLGHLLCRLPPGMAAALLVISGALLAIYAALFASGYPLF
jgi:hypothetical protein